MSAIKMMPLLLLLTVGGFQCTQGLPRLKRDLQNLCLIFQTYVPRSCMDFSSYGCSCGPNKARAPIDGIDSCCAAKDRCYAKLSCDYNIPTEVKCENGACQCTAADKSSCAYKACKCDVKAAECFTRYTFNESLINYDYTQCANVSDLTVGDSGERLDRSGGKGAGSWPESWGGRKDDGHDEKKNEKKNGKKKDDRDDDKNGKRKDDRDDDKNGKKIKKGTGRK